MASKILPGWQWQHNFLLNPKGRIWMAWKSSIYQIEILKVAEQYIHGKVLHYSSNKRFYITMIYGLNHAPSRQMLWEDLQAIAPSFEPWCIMGDFNAVIHREDRIGGDEVTEHEM